jgi:MFS family permease
MVALLTDRNQRAVAAVFAVHGAGLGSIATRTPWLQEHLGLTPGVLGLALLFPSVGAFLAMPTAGWLAHRYGGRLTTRVALALTSLALALPAAAPGLPWLCVAFALSGTAAGTCDVAMNAEGVIVERRLGRSIMSGLHGMWSVGALAGAGAGAVAAQAGVDARVHLGLMALVLLIVGGVAGRGLPEGRPDPGVQAPPRFAVPTRAVLAIGLVGLCATFAEGASSNWAAVYIKTVTAAGPGVAAACFTVFALSMAVARLGGDAIVRRFGPVATVRGGAALAALGGLVVVTSRTPAPGIAGFALFGLGIAVIVPLVFAAAGSAAATPSQGIAGVATITYLSILVAPAATGWVAGATSFPVAFALITCIAATMAFLAGALRPRAVAPEPVLAGGG